MANKYIAKKLIVEGEQDKRVIPYLIEANGIPWSNTQEKFIVHIEPYGTGLIHKTKAGIQFGVWIMPDNHQRGMLETFLAYMIPDESETLWQYAQEVVAEAKNRGSSFIDAHLDKAYIYTWLAWPNPPGRQLHNAIMETILNPQHPKAQTFVNWFKTLYDL